MRNETEVVHSAGNERLIAIIIAGTVFNLALGALVRFVQLPIYLDAIGTIVVAILGGPLAGAATGVASFAIGSVLVSPVLIWFSGTQVAIALFAYFVSQRGWLRSWPRVVVCGIGLGIVAAVVSAPVIAGLFGGLTGSGASLITAYLLTTGKNVIKAVVLSGLAAEPVDKTLQLVIAVALIRSSPRRTLRAFRQSSLDRNGWNK